MRRFSASSVGFSVACASCSSVGKEVGTSVGKEVGTSVGKEVGTSVGMKAGSSDGTEVGSAVGAAVSFVSGLTGPQPQPVSIRLTESTSARRTEIIRMDFLVTAMIPRFDYRSCFPCIISSSNSAVNAKRHYLTKTSQFNI